MLLKHFTVFKKSSKVIYICPTSFTKTGIDPEKTQDSVKERPIVCLVILFLRSKQNQVQETVERSKMNSSRAEELPQAVDQQFSSRHEEVFLEMHFYTLLL